LLAGFTVRAASGKLGLHCVVIDAGHGGKDPGAVSKDKVSYEKTITLDVAKRLGKLISDVYGDEVKVVYTRSDDRFVSLASRADIANKANGDIFISLHVNSTKSTQPSGFSVHVLGESSIKNRDLFAFNMEVCKLENSVILLEDDYSTRYQGFNPSDPESYIFMQLMQNSHLEQSLDAAQMISDCLKKSPLADSRGVWQNPFYVLWKTSMPSVLVEMGFISNPGDLSVLRSGDSRAKIAACLFESFCRYKREYDRSVLVAARIDTILKAPATNIIKIDVPKREAEKKCDILYGTQVLSGKNLLSKKDKIFKGWEPKIIKVGAVYKYVLGTSEDKAKAKDNFEKIRRDFASCFMVSIKGENLSVFKP